MLADDPMSIYLHNFMDQDKSSFARDYAGLSMREMIKRFPPTDSRDPKKAVILRAGMTINVHALFVHSYFRGNLIKKISNKEYKMRFEFCNFCNIPKCLSNFCKLHNIT
jgi:hypothetical protein